MRTIIIKKTNPPLRPLNAAPPILKEEILQNAVYRIDLNIIDSELPNFLLSLILDHQILGTAVRESSVSPFKI